MPDNRPRSRPTAHAAARPRPTAGPPARPTASPRPTARPTARPAARPRHPARAAGILAAVAVAATLSACGSTTAPRPGTIAAIGAENEYANVIGQIGGKYVTVRAIESNPNTDPHTFEASPSVAQEVSAARLVVQNGVGYDSYMNRIEGASPSSSRVIIDVQKLLGLPDSTPNPHLWYRPTTMPALARALVSAFSKLQPAHAAYFRAQAAAFERSLQPWYQAIAQFKATYANTPVAVTEPVGNYMLRAVGATILTPFSFQADVMNGVDPAPQSVAFQGSLLTRHRVKVLLYNQQVTDSLTQSFLQEARRSGIPIVGVYETMPTPGYDYQSWMLAEVRALERAVADKVSTEKL